MKKQNIKYRNCKYMRFFRNSYPAKALHLINSSSQREMKFYQFRITGSDKNSG